MCTNHSTHHISTVTSLVSNEPSEGFHYFFFNFVCLFSSLFLHLDTTDQKYLELYEDGVVPWDIKMTVEVLKILCQTTRTVPPTVSLTPSLNPKLTLT